MKKVFLGLLLSVAAGAVSAQNTNTATSQEQSTSTPPVTATFGSEPQHQDGTAYWYNPNSNIYYNDATQDYWYYDKPASKWQTGKELPSSYSSDTTGRYQVYYKGTDVWKDNKTHRMKMKSKSSGNSPKAKSPSGN